jgi:hypothetical protein
LISNDKTGIFNAYYKPLNSSTPIQLTQCTVVSVFGVSWFPKDDRIIYTADRCDDELDHLYVRELLSNITEFIPDKDLKAYFFV